MEQEILYRTLVLEKRAKFRIETADVFELFHQLSRLHQTGDTATIDKDELIEAHGEGAEP